MICTFGLWLSSTGLQGQDRFHNIQFEDTTARAGLIKPLTAMYGHGGAWGDFNGDGHVDLFVGGFCDRPNSAYAPASGPVASQLLRNRGDGTFEPVKQSAASFHGRTSGAVFADLDNNSTLELYVANNCKGKSNRKEQPQRSAQLRNVNLFRNQKGKLIDISADSGACPDSFRTARNIGVFDYNGDGKLDLFVVGDRFTSNPASVLFANLGNLKFKNVNDQAGLPNDVFGLGLAVADLNNDHRPDFFVPHSNRFFLSQPDNRYKETKVQRELFAWKPLDGEDWPCGAAFGDLNRDGLLDLVLSIHHVKARNRVFINMGVKDGVPQFRDVTREVGLDKPIPVRCPHVEIQDFDNDGWPDIYFSAAWRKGDTVLPLVYQNRGVKSGKRLPRFMAPKPIGDPMVYYPAGPTADYDRDGRLDIFLINWFASDRSRLLRNRSKVQHWLQLRVVGNNKVNAMGIGSKIRLYKTGQMGKPDALLGYQQIQIGYGYASGQEAIAHFGLGAETQIDIQITLPDGRIIERQGVKADQRLVINEP